MTPTLGRFLRLSVTDLNPRFRHNSEVTVPIWFDVNKPRDLVGAMSYVACCLLLGLGGGVGISLVPPFKLGGEHSFFSGDGI